VKKRLLTAIEKLRNYRKRLYENNDDSLQKRRRFISVKTAFKKETKLFPMKQNFKIRSETTIMDLELKKLEAKLQERI
jgi:transposase